MRICILNEFCYPDMMGGTGMVLSDLARRLHDDHGVEIDVWTSSNSYRGGKQAYKSEEDWDGIRIRRVQVEAVERSRTRKRLFVNSWFAVLILFRLLFRHNYDCIVVSTAPPSLAGVTWLLRLLFRIPYIYVIYDLEPDRAVALKVVGPKSLFIRVAGRIQKLWLQAAARVVGIGRCMKDHLVETYRLQPEKISVIEVGADPEALKPGPKDNQYRKMVGDGAFLVLNAGNFARYHDFDAVLDAAKELQSTDPDVRFLLVGNGVKEQNVRDRIANEKISNVTVMPFVADDLYEELLAAADVSLVTLESGMSGLCVPSKFYSILASGRPTLAMMSPSCEVARVIREEGCGEVVPAAAAPELAQAIRKLKSDPEALELMGHRARHALEARFGYSRMAQKLFRILALENRSGKVAYPFQPVVDGNSRRVL